MERNMASIVSKAGTTDISVDDSPSREGLPILEMRNLVIGNTVKVTASFFARTSQAGRANGFYYQIAAVNATEVVALTSVEGIFQGSDGWQSCVLVAFFTVKDTTESPTEDIDFEILLRRGDLSGQGQIHGFTLMGEVISSID